MATIIIPNFLTQKVVNGLNSYQYTTGSTAMHSCRIEVDHREASVLVISIVQAGSVNATLATVTLTGGSSTSGMPQNTAILKALANCVSGDTLTFTLTSSSAI